MKKFSIRHTLLIVVLLGCVLYIPFFAYKKSTQESLLSLTSNAASVFGAGKVRFSLPVRLRIPSLNVNAIVEYVGLTKGGAMDVPAGPDNVAWFELGVRPGEAGSAVIAGHSGYKNNRPAVFDDLDKLHIGDKIQLQTVEGKEITFVVRKIKSYGRNQNAGDVFGSNDGASHLNLITCTGDWNPTARTHSDRLVVFTDREI